MEHKETNGAPHIRVLLIPVIIVWLLCAVFSLTGCKKEATDFNVGETVYLNDINPKKSFVPYNCCECPCIVISKYFVQDVQFYSIKDLNDSTLTHLYANQLKP